MVLSLVLLLFYLSTDEGAVMVFKAILLVEVNVDVNVNVNVIRKLRSNSSESPRESDRNMKYRYPH